MGRADRLSLLFDGKLRNPVFVGEIAPGGVVDHEVVSLFPGQGPPDIPVQIVNLPKKGIQVPAVFVAVGRIVNGEGLADVLRCDTDGGG